MSLTSQLYNGELGRWCEKHLTTANLIGDVQRQLTVAERQRGGLTPVRPAGRVESSHWAAVGGAFGARMALLTDGAPPYYALMGAVRAGLVSRKWAEAICAEFPTHRDVPQDAVARWSQFRPGSRGWIDLGGMADPGKPTEHEPVLTDFVRRTVRLLEEHAPPGQLGTPGAERQLARSCWVFAAWESCYRGGTIPADVADVHAYPGYSAGDLHQVATEPVLDELVELAGMLRSSRTLDDWHRSARSTGALGISGPVMVPHWADGDLVVGSALLDVKTVARVDNPVSMTRWLWQILAYAWLDVQDLYEIRSVGLYLARHGVTVTWGLDAFCISLLGGTGRDNAAREDFLRVARRVIHDEGAGAPGPWQGREKHLYGT